VEEDLYRVISDDIEKLDFEIDVAKHSLKKHEQS
jgi:5-bromo-4-chloroindolyl phosphate hydrolysis protein